MLSSLLLVGGLRLRRLAFSGGGRRRLAVGRRSVARRPARLRSAPADPAPPPWDGFVTLTEEAKRGHGPRDRRGRGPDRADPARAAGHDRVHHRHAHQDPAHVQGPGRQGLRDRRPGGEEGRPLIDLYSKELAEAKSAYEIERIQWLYDKNLLDIRGTLRQDQGHLRSSSSRRRRTTR